MIEIKQLNKSQLLKYIDSESFRTGVDIPISYHRAISQTKNPRLKEEDIILLLAYLEGSLVGYLGILPDMVFPKNSEPIRVGWLSCFWVSAQSRRKGIGIKLISKSLELWNYNIISAGYVPSTKRIYDKTNHFIDQPYSKKGLRLYLKSDLYNILPPKKAIFYKLRFLLKTMDFCANTLLNIRLNYYKEDVSQLQLEYIDQLDNEVNDFIEPMQEKQLFKRSTKDLNWIINNPWIIAAKKKDEFNKKYYFSSTAKSFNFYGVKVKNSNNKLIAFMLLAKRDKSLKLPYLFHDNCTDIIVKVINHHLIKWKIKTFTTYNSRLAKSLMNNKTPGLIKKEIKSNYLISKVFKEKILNSDFEIQDGDGDRSFT